MKKFYLYIMIISVLLVSCKKNDTNTNNDSSTITVSVISTNLTSAKIAVSASSFKDLGLFTIGVCYSTNLNPTSSDAHIEFSVNPDTISSNSLNLVIEIPQLAKNTTYFVKGYIVTSGKVIYSMEQTLSTLAQTLTVSVSDDYIPSSQDYWVVLSKKSTTILTQKLQNGTKYTFKDNIPDVVDLHVFKWNSSTTKLVVESYTGITPSEFSLDNPYTSSNVGYATVTVSDIANFLSWGVASSWWWNSTTSSATNTLSTSLSKNPDALFISYIPTNSSEAPKYKYVTGVTPYSNYNYTMSDLTSMTNYLDISLPTNSNFTYTISGYNTDYYTDYLRYHGYLYTAGYPGTFKLYYPSGITTNYYFYSYYNTSNQQNFYNKLGTLPTTFFTTFPSITISNAAQYKTTISGISGYSDYEVVDLCGFYSNSGLYIQWDYYKQPQVSDSVNIPEFPADVKALINNLSINDLSFSDVGYFDIINSQVNSYSSYVDLLIKKSSRFFDVIKERRYYYQWINKKSFDKKIRTLNSQE